MVVIQKKIILCIIFALSHSYNYPAYRDYDNSPYTAQTASVRIGNSICTDEQQFIVERTSHVKISLESLLRINLDGKKIPRIALCVSGGGYRAMITFLGAIQGIPSISLTRSGK